jgi:hypothetical protein
MTNTVPLTEVELKRLRAFINASTWTFAKTLAWCPHFYCKLSDTPHLKDEYPWFVHLIHDKGYYMMFYERKVRYLDVDDYRYWEMDDEVPPEECYLINRADNTPAGKVYGPKV